MMSFRALAVTAALAGALVAVSAQAQQGRQGQKPPADAKPVQKQEKTFPTGASWAAISLNGRPIGDRRATLLIDSNLRGTGFGGCNNFSATAYPLREQGLAVGPVALTNRSCDKGLTDFERQYLTALRAARNWDIVEGRLVIKGSAGELRFERGI